MRKRARRVVTGLLVLCCAIAGIMSVMYVKTGRMDRDERLAVAGMGASLCNVLFPTGVVSADSAETLQSVPLASSQPSQSPASPTAGAWVTATARSIATFFSSLYATVRDFFVSGQALKLLETVAQTIEDFAVRLFAPLASVILPLLQRVFPGFSLTRELLAVWIFWIAVVLVLLVLVLLLRPRRTTRKRLPKASPRAAGQGENAIEFGLVEQGPAPEPAGVSQQQPVQQEAVVAPQQEETAPAESTASEQSAPAPTSSPSIPEISLEPLGFYEGEEARAEEPSPASVAEAPTTTAPVPPIVELASVAPESSPSPEAAEPAEAPAAEVPPEALLEAPASEPQAPEPVVETAPAPFVEPDLTPIGQVTPPASAQPEEAAREPEVPAEALAQPLATSEPAATETEEAVSEENVPASTQPETLVAEPEPQPSSAPETSAAASADLQAAQPVPSGADVLSHMLEEEGAFQNAVKPVVSTGPAEAASEAPEPEPAAEPSLFTGDIDLETLVQEGVVSDAAAVGQLFGGGYRGEIAKLAISAKDLQNVPEEIRNVVKLTIVALSPIELSIARDVAMRLEAPGFVGEALLVAKKMGYQNYLTTYKNISRNYKDVSILETASLKPPQRGSADSGDGLISFS